MRKRTNNGPDFLAECATAAINAGVSYGKYMAMRYEKGIKRETDDLPEPNAVCKICGKPFFTSCGNLAYCSPECRERSFVNGRVKANRKRLAKLKNEEGKESKK